jgi:hypothetical protein
MFVNEIFKHGLNELKHVYKMKAELSPEHSVIGKKKKGLVDWAITINEAILMVIEAKATDLDLCIAQNVLQIIAAHEQNLDKNIDLGDTMYGMATIASKSVLVKAVFGDAKCTVTLSDIFPLPIRDNNVSEESLREHAAALLGCFIAIAKEQANKI